MCLCVKLSLATFAEAVKEAFEFEKTGKSPKCWTMDVTMPENVEVEEERDDGDSIWAYTDEKAVEERTAENREMVI